MDKQEPTKIGPLGDECPNCEYRELYYDYETNTYHCSHCGGVIPEKTKTQDGAAEPNQGDKMSKRKEDLKTKCMTLTAILGINPEGKMRECETGCGFYYEEDEKGNCRLVDLVGSLTHLIQRLRS